MENERVLPPPPVPPRNSFNNSGSFYGSGGMNASPWTTSMSYGNSFGSTYGNYYSPYSSPYGAGMHGSSPVNFIPSVARGPFETVESVVQAFSSISMLLESTYGALIASVRSVFAVGEQLTRMKSQFGHLYAALAFTRLLKWFREHFGWIIGHKPTPDLIWTNVQDKQTSVKGSPSPATWPLLLYMSFLIGAPYLTWKFVKSTGVLQQNESGSDKWMTEEDSEHFLAQANYNFQATRQDELSFNLGDSLRIAPSNLQPSSDRGWLLAAVDGTDKPGLVPANRIKILGKRASSKA